MVCSQIFSDEQCSNLWSASEYSSNLAWIFNATNGNLNNNNKMNGNSCRGSLEFGFDKTDELDDGVLKLSELIGFYHITRQHKRNKISQLIFEYNQRRELIELLLAINYFEYIPRVSICFIITYPKIREVIAANFRDRIAQTYLVRKLTPYMEQYLHPDSYSCRVGKGSLRAVLQLREYIAIVSERYTRDCWVYKFDIKSFFMSIDTNIFAPRLIVFIQERYTMDDKEILIYLARVIFQSLPQAHCIRKSQPFMWDGLSQDKSLLHRCDGVGIPIGNVTSQMMCNFVTTAILFFLAKFGIRFAHYTDDNGGAVPDKEDFLKTMRLLKAFVAEDLHLQIHPFKFYLQHYTKGIEMLGFKIKKSRLLPSDRIFHNFDWKITRAIRRAEDNEDYVYRNKESFMQTLNSYLGTLKWCNSYRLRKMEVERVSNSKWNAVFDFDTDNYLKVTIKPRFNIVNYYIRANKKRKRLLKLETL